jgi:hypothetical protein
LVLGGDLVVCGGGIGSHHRSATAMSGARYLAEDRGAFDTAGFPSSNEEPEPEAEVKPAMAPLFEVAAAHDGQENALAWLRMFYRQCGIDRVPGFCPLI